LNKLIYYCLIMACIFASNSLRAEDQTVLFWRLKSLGIEEPIAVGISKVLSSELERIDGFTLVPQAKVTQATQQQESLLSCQGKLGCLIELGQAVSASQVVSGVIGKLGDVFSFDIKLIDVGSEMEIRRVAQTWSGETDSLIEVMRQTATRLLKPESYKGNLSLNVNISGVSVFIDGDLVGQTPIEKSMRLSPGRHALKLAAAGFKDYEAFIDVPFDRTVPVEIKMESQLISGVISVDKAEDFYSIGVKAGLVSNSGSFLAPHLSIEFGLRLPFWGGRLSVLLESGIWGSVEKSTTRISSLGEIPVETKILVWPTQLNVALRLLPDYPFSPYLVAGGGFYLIWQTLQPADYTAQGYRDSVFGFQAGAGLEYRLGPGVILVEARYLHVWVAGPLREGGVNGLLGGLGALLGYRFLL